MNNKAKQAKQALADYRAKAKHGERIKALYDDYNRLNRLI